ncbi:MAG: pentapeptide repeat-containing protein [Kofleriaceae bacterium]
MADYRVILAQFPTAKAASAAKHAFSEAFAAHLVALTQREHYSAELTDPLLAFARSEGFMWDEDDRFTWDDDDANPDLQVGTIRKVLVIYHAAAMQLAHVGLQAFARRRGAKVTMFWDPDPFGTVHIKVAKPAGFEQAFDALVGEHDAELELSDDEPRPELGRLVIKLGKKTRYVALTTHWGVGGILLALGARPDIELGLELPPLPPERADAARDLGVAGPVCDIIHAIRRGHIDRPTVEECIAEGIYTGKRRWHGSFAGRDLRKLTLAERPLVAARFAGALLEGTNFTKADLSHANFTRVFANGAVFTGATLASADFTGADLRNASFRDADLRAAIWRDAILDGADFEGARR